MTTATAIRENDAPAALQAKGPSPVAVDFILEGVITAESPIHITSADTSKKHTAGTIQVLRQSGGQSQLFCIIKGETTKGPIRALAVDHAERIIQHRNGNDDKVFGLSEMYRLKLGGIKAGDKQKPDDTFGLQKLVRRNPIAQIFGQAEPVWLGGQVEFCHAVAQQPDAAAVFPGGARRDPVLSDPNLLASFSEKDQQGWLTYSDSNKEASAISSAAKAKEAQIKKLQKSGGGADAMAEIAALRVEVKKMKDDVKETRADGIAGNAINRPLDAKMAIMAGARLDHKIRGTRIDMGAFGFFLKTLEMWSDHPRIGGHASRGFGEFSAVWNLRLRVVEGALRKPFVDVGTVTLSETRFDLPDHPLVTQALEAYQDLIDDPSVDFQF